MINISDNHIACLIPVEQLCKTQQSVMEIAHTEAAPPEIYCAAQETPRHPLPAATHFHSLFLMQQ